jgi:lipopolysaccharide transport system ATP-binding protein
MDYYNALIAEKENSTVRQSATADGRIQTISGSGEVSLGEMRLLDTEGRPVETAAVGAPVALEVSVTIEQPIERLVVGYMIKDRLGQPVFGTNTHHLGEARGPLAAGESLVLRFEFALNIGEGSYSVAVAAHDSDTHVTRNYEWRDVALVFNVINQSMPVFVGTAFLPTAVRVAETTQ